MDCDNRMKLLLKIQEMEFVAIELNLYLDNNPCDQDALNDYNCAIQALNGLLEEYESKYGALSQKGFHGTDRWNWIDSPWPWEM